MNEKQKITIALENTVFEFQSKPNENNISESFIQDPARFIGVGKLVETEVNRLAAEEALKISLSGEATMKRSDVVAEVLAKFATEVPDPQPMDLFTLGFALGGFLS